MSQLKVEYIDHMGSDLSVVNAARVSYGKVSDTLTEKDKKLIAYLVEHKHLTPLESCVLSVRIHCPLFIRSQLAKHRTSTINEISRRYTSENIEFYEPTVYRKQHSKSKQCSDGTLPDAENMVVQAVVQKAHIEALNAYNKLLDMNVSREMARGILPQNLMTQFIMTCNLRNWAHLVKLRDDSHAQEEAQIIARQIKQILLEKFPVAAGELLK